MQDTINKLRFFIPPILFLFSLYLIDHELLNKFLSWLPSDNRFHSKDSVLYGIVSGTLLLLTLGFIISGIGAWIINHFGLTVSGEDRDKYKNSGSKKWIAFLASKEYRQWKNVSDKEGKIKYVGEQINKRWQMFTANLNACIALSLALLTTLIICIYQLIFTQIRPAWVWPFLPTQTFATLVIYSAILILLLLNTYNTNISINELDKQADKDKRLEERQNNKKTEK